jgi:hypothetical protein
LAIVNIKGATPVRFLTPTDGWDERTGNTLSVPARWKIMLVDLLFDSGGELLMSAAAGVARNSIKAFRAQGIPFFEYSDLPDHVIAAIEKHFTDDARELLKRLKALARRYTASRLTVVHAKPR